jgi:hypothetical protein
MIMVRFAGQHAARQALAAAGPAKGSAPDAPQVEVVIEADERGKRRAIDPTRGPAAVAKSDIVSWGGFGLVYGIIVGFAGNGGVLGAAERGLVTAIAWGPSGSSPAPCSDCGPAAASPRGGSKGSARWSRPVPRW